ncbi:MAG TPA: hypothetical protein VJT31_22675 [Rugosimonospora sp.]|nr:hypothetical protein [Rugosimonospora sp.]
MRRLAVCSLAALAAAALALAGCDSGGAGTPTAAGASAGAQSPDTSAAQPSSDASVTANTRQVCDRINQAVATNANAFGSDLGTLAGHLAGNNQAAAATARADAINRLKALAVQVRVAAGLAQDPAVQAAARDAAGQIEALANDPAALTSIKSAGDVAAVIERLTRATDAMNKVCV